MVRKCNRTPEENIARKAKVYGAVGPVLWRLLLRVKSDACRVSTQTPFYATNDNVRSRYTMWYASNANDVLKAHKGTTDGHSAEGTDVQAKCYNYGFDGRMIRTVDEALSKPSEKIVTSPVFPYMRSYAIVFQLLCRDCLRDGLAPESLVSLPNDSRVCAALAACDATRAFVNVESSVTTHAAREFFCMVMLARLPIKASDAEKRAPRTDELALFEDIGLDIKKLAAAADSWIHVIESRNDEFGGVIYVGEHVGGVFAKKLVARRSENYLPLYDECDPNAKAAVERSDKLRVNRCHMKQKSKAIASNGLDLIRQMYS